MKILYFIALAAVIALMICYIKRRLRNGGGCCGEHEALTRSIHVSDRNCAHYPYYYTAQIEGMVCGNCVRRVENLFNATGECFASAVLSEKTAKIYAKRRIERKDVVKMLENNGFTLIEWEEYYESE